MRMSKLAKNISTYLPVLAVLVVTVIGLWMGKGLYPSLFPSGTNTPTQPRALLSLGTEVPCNLIYTSLPPKCKTFDGSFVPADGISPLVILEAPKIK